MSAFNGFAKKFKKNFFQNKASVQQFSQKKDSTTGRMTESFKEIQTNIPCSFWETSNSNARMSGKLTTDTTANIAIAPEDLSVSINRGDKVVLENGREFSVVKSSDIQYQNGMIRLRVKEEYNGN